MRTLHFVKLCSFVFPLLLFPGYGRAQNTKSEWLAVCAQCLSPTVISKSGIGASHAVAVAKVTPEGAKGWCENWQPGGDLKSCVREQLTSKDAKKTYRATADCTGGRITAIDGKTYNLAGVWTSEVGTMSDAEVQNGNPGRFLPGVMPLTREGVTIFRLFPHFLTLAPFEKNKSQCKS